MKKSKNVKLLLLQNIPLALFVLVFVVFGLATRNWFTWTNFSNILTQSSYIGILAIGITFVLLTGRTDLSVGAIMYLSAASAALMIQSGVSIVVALLFVVKVGIPPFVVTIGTMTAGRAIGLLMTHSEQIAMPAELVSSIGSSRLFGFLPYPVIIFAIVAAVATIFLRMTTTGRQIYAIGYDMEAAKKGGINVDRVGIIAYVLCGFFSALSAIVSVAQVGNVVPAFGEGYEFDAIAASVLGGTSLAGGIGSIFPGVIIGTTLIQMVEARLVFLQVDLYIQPLISALVILLAVFLDSVRTHYIRKLETRNIRAEED